MGSLNFDAVLHGQYLRWLMLGGATTVGLFVAALVCGFSISLVLAAVRALPYRWVQRLVAGYVNYHRNVPTLVQLFIWYFGIPQLLPTSTSAWINAHNAEFVFALIALSLNVAAYLSEDLRSGLRAVSQHQADTARALGMRHAQVLRHVLLPQAVRFVVPSLINQALTLFKTTSLAMAIGVAEITYASRQIENETYRTFETYAIASAFYLAVSFMIMLAGAFYNRQYPPMTAR
ncbi:MAG: amino acid ABC transporter permease [Caldimonas sp.]